MTRVAGYHARASAQAAAIVAGTVLVAARTSDGLDNDGDGIGCEASG